MAKLKARTSDGAAQFIRCGVAFGPDWREVPASLSKAKTERIRNEPWLEVREVADQSQGGSGSGSSSKKKAAKKKTAKKGQDTAAPKSAGSETDGGKEAAYEGGETDPLALINAATSEQLQVVDGIGPAYAKAIVDGQPFQSLDAVLALDGIDQDLLNAIIAELQ